LARIAFDRGVASAIIENLLRVATLRLPGDGRLAAALFALAVMLALGCRSGGADEPKAATPVSMPMAATVDIGDASFEVEVARTPAERAKGLSGRESMAPGAGMLFVFASGRTSSFWMKGMEIALDFVWIGERCTVVATDLEVPPPALGTPDEQLPFYVSANPAAYTLEVNAGEVDRLGIEVGDRVRFSGVSTPGDGC
jgi:uncharacterized membrane protein (UPF0127 family)